jgi:ribose 5-phosphate isomerase A
MELVAHDRLKRQAACLGADLIETGMVVGLGSGSTVRFALEEIGKRIAAGVLRDIVGIPSSSQTEQLARELGIPVTTLDQQPEIDLTIDGADEVGPNLSLIKGGGGALLREKILMEASRTNVIIVDENKLSPVLGTKWPVPVEVLPLARQPVWNFLVSLGARVSPRENEDGTSFLTDQQNIILDADFGPITDPARLAARLSGRAGIIEHGLFLGLASEIVAAGKNGVQRIRN